MSAETGRPRRGRPRRRGARGLAAALAAALVLASGCAYYNGMFNANRAAGDAERLERQGRPGEARDRWQRAAMHAESLVARHPRSRWADDALLLRGRALLRLDFPTDAAVVLEQAVRRAESPAVRAEALTLLGRANLQLGRAGIARAVLDSALEERHPQVRSEALFLRGRAELALGRPEAALADLGASGEPGAAVEAARAHLALGDAGAAEERLATVLDGRTYREADWRGPLDSLARAGGAEAAGRLVERLVARPGLTGGERARLLLDDGDRSLARQDTAGARSRFARAVEAAPDSADARSARVRLLRLTLAAAASEADVADAGEPLQTLADLGGAPGREAQQLLDLVGRVGSLAEDSVAPDAQWFARAELLRDSLRAVPLAARAFAEMAARFPASPWAPKGLVAAIAAGAPGSDSLRALLDARYPDSPYRLAAIGLAAQGADAEAYRVLEDSLGRVLGVAAAGQRAAPRRAARDRDEGEEIRRPVRPPAVRPGAPAIPPQLEAPNR